MPYAPRLLEVKTVKTYKKNNDLRIRKVLVARCNRMPVFNDGVAVYGNNLKSS